MVEDTLIKLERLNPLFLLELITDSRSATESLQSSFEALSETVIKGILDRKQWQIAQTSQAICRLLFPASSEGAHSQACKTWQGTTSGSWFLDGPFAEWPTSNDPSQRVMVLTGRSGSGKTTLMSQAVERAQAYISEEGDAKIGYRYVAYNDVVSQGLGNVLGS